MIIIGNCLLTYDSSDELTIATDEKPHLTTIPQEILLYLAKVLPESSSAALSLCSPKFLHVLGPEYLSFIQEGKQIPHPMPWDDSATKFQTLQQSERSKFLVLLGRDMPYMIFCYLCQRFPEPSKTGSDFDAKEKDRKKAIFDNLETVIRCATGHTKYYH